VGALGVAAMAFTHFGVDLPLSQTPPRRFDPRKVDPAARRAWAQAVARARFTAD